MLTRVFLMTPEAVQGRPLVLILVVAALTRLAAILYVQNFHDPQIWEWGVIARNFLDGNGFSFWTVDGVALPSAYMPPAYALLLIGMFWLLGDGATAYILTQLLQAMFGVGLVYLVYALARAGWDEKTALWAALMAALYPPFIYMPTEMHSISFYIVIGVGATYLVYRYMMQEGVARWHPTAIGVLLGMLILFRAEALLLPPLFSFLIWRSGGQRARAHACIVLLLAGLCILPWVARNQAVFGQFVATTTAGGINLWYGHNPDAIGTQHHPWPSALIVAPRPGLRERLDSIPPTREYELVMERIYRQEAWAFLRENPGREVTLALRKLFFFWTVDWSHPKARQPAYWIPSLLLSAAFFLGAFLNYRTLLGINLILTIQILLATVLAVVFFVLPRYRIALDPILLPFAASALVQLAGRFSRGRSQEQVTDEPALTYTEG